MAPIRSLSASCDGVPPPMWTLLTPELGAGIEGRATVQGRASRVEGHTPVLVHLHDASQVPVRVPGDGSPVDVGVVDGEIQDVELGCGQEDRAAGAVRLVA